MILKFINTGLRPGKFNMEFDEALARDLQNGIGFPTLRVYGWYPPAISIGFHQNIEDFDHEKIIKSGFDIVRRPTGGKAILHAHELTYCVVTKIIDQGPRTIYQSINECLLRGLTNLGINASLSLYSDNFRQLYKLNTSIPCFSSSAKNEIQFEGKKLIGSAQRRYGDVILQHGSLLLGSEHRRIIEFLAPHISDSGEIINNTLLSCTTEVETILKRNVSFNEIAAAIKKGFEDSGNIIFEDSDTTVANSSLSPLEECL
ncbi:MAG: lipoate--protein ligase family protein [Bacteroidota bacterium]|nr:lipoate--protein ligase family protein [Bacteroidota bacterium]